MEAMCKGCKAEMVEGQRFCGKCGAESKEENTMVKCSSCQGDMLKAHIFCPACGTKAGTADAELDAWLERAPVFVKAQVDNATKLGEALPLIEIDQVDHKEVDQIIKAAVTPNEEGRLDVMPILERMLHGQNQQSVQIQAFAEHGQAWNRHLSEGQAELVKANVLLARKVVEHGKTIEMLKGEIASLGATPRGRKTAQTLVDVAARRAAGEGDKGGGENGGGAGNELRGEKLFLKAKIGYQKDPSLHNAGAISSLETYKAMNASAEEVAGLDPPLGQWLERCLQSAA